MVVGESSASGSDDNNFYGVLEEETITLQEPGVGEICCTKGKIPISIALGQDKPISPHAVHFSNTLGVLTRDTFPVNFFNNDSCWISLIQHLLDLLSIRCSMCGRSSGDRTTAISRSLTILNKLVPTHPQIEQSGARLTLPMRPLPHSTIPGAIVMNRDILE
ncbi:(R)-mandelonitrile lyase 1-like [Cucumis melo var. makuwa]|uniref:(R)-mandelonitrile lyase 1-like n=1 Tax=Cucumis melo var. makuwa TaxID=1194695 RepID=A0A5D3BY56_CUCMM|nr:(R)-mandelonitrile lyase 1-like [Cucumis melo var. makuwa]